MSEPGDELTPLPDDPQDRPKLSRSPYIALGVAALVVSTVFATVAALATTREEQAAPAPSSEDTVETSTAETYTTDPNTTSAPSRSTTSKPRSSTTTTTSEDGETTTDETTTDETTTPGRPTNTRPPTTTTPPNQAPLAEFNVDCSNLACDFDGGPSSDPDGNITTYSWSFGANGITASHTFESAGTFDITLTVTDNRGKKTNKTKPVTVTTPTTTSGN
ncbi:PKD domain-containing protein [Actinophytocola sp.]|uniref:PKD domain-containing protein n=1 Tax=Actinophytocola sp. TaxID=1872138 RepID=UPI003D6AEB63